MAKAWDNRYGCGLAIELLKELKVKLTQYSLFWCNSTRRSRLRGAQTAANMIKPDLFYALDASPANDASGNKKSLVN